MPRIDYGKDPLGNTISGTTTIIGGNLGWNKNPLCYWNWEQGSKGHKFMEKAEEAATAGTILHYLIDCDLKIKTPDVSQYPKELIDLAETAFLNFLQWKDSVHFKIYKSEVSLVHKELWYGSTIDCIAFINDKRCLFDWKSSKGVYEDYLVQVASYKENWDFNFPLEPLEGGVHLLKINKEVANYTHHWWGDVSVAWEAFKALLEIHKRHKALKGMV